MANAFANSAIPALLTEREAAERLRRSIDTIRRERRRGRIGYTRIGRRVFYTDAQLLHYLERQETKPAEAER